jgi:solute carrier family 35 protein F1/2
MSDAKLPLEITPVAILSEIDSPSYDNEKRSIEITEVAPPPVRPPIDYSSVPALARSTLARFKSLWTRRFILCLLAGQIVSLCITCTNVTTTELVLKNWALPTTQTFFL